MQTSLDERGTDWFLKRVFERLLKKHSEAIIMGRYIMKQPLYREMSWWFRCTREETRVVLRLLSERYAGVRFSNRGLFIPRVYAGVDGSSPPLLDSAGWAGTC